MLQSIIFKKTYFDKNDTISWIYLHGYHPIKFHETEHFYRYRMLPPVKNARYRTVSIHPGIEFILMYRN